VSKGPGKWERAILEALDSAPAFYLSDLLPMPHTRAQIVALNRAARNLADAGKIATCHWLTRSWLVSGDGYGEGERPHGFVAIYRAGYPAPDRSQITRLAKCCTGISTNPMQHLNTVTNSGRRERRRRKRGPIIDGEIA
jgi:hypothetical protein